MKIDDFESLFRSAAKPVFEYQEVRLARVVLVSDQEDARGLAEAVEAFFRHLDVAADHLALVTLGSSDWSDVATLLRRIEQISPELVVTHRLLRDDRSLHHSLGSVVDTLTQAIDVPVLLLPDRAGALDPVRTVMVVTDHLTGDHRLVSWAVHLAPDDGTVVLAHIEEEPFLEHILEAIGRIQGVPTERTREQLGAKLLERPRDYIQAVAAELAARGIHEKVVPVVRLGEPISEYRGLASEHGVNLLICNTKDPRQRAMEALSHALAVELRDLPLLLL
jgi:nucleotide-binding universal stress UspA family protein